MTRMPAPDADRGVRPARRWPLGEIPWVDDVERLPPARVIIEHDSMGDPDGFCRLVHHLLGPSADIRVVVSSHLREAKPWDTGDRQAAYGALVVRDVLACVGVGCSGHAGLGLMAPGAPPAEYDLAFDDPMAKPTGLALWQESA